MCHEVKDEQADGTEVELCTKADILKTHSLFTIHYLPLPHVIHFRKRSQNASLAHPQTGAFC